MGKKSNNHVLACVTTQKNCESLIQRGAEVAKEHGASLTVVHVARQGFNFLGQQEEGAALEYLFEIAKQHGADLNVVRSDDVIHTLTRIAKDAHVGMMVMGMANNQTDSTVINALKVRLPSVAFEVIYHE